MVNTALVDNRPAEAEELDNSSAMQPTNSPEEQIEANRDDSLGHFGDASAEIRDVALDIRLGRAERSEMIQAEGDILEDGVSLGEIDELMAIRAERYDALHRIDIIEGEVEIDRTLEREEQRDDDLAYEALEAQLNMAANTLVKSVFPNAQSLDFGSVSIDGLREIEIDEEGCLKKDVTLSLNGTINYADGDPHQRIINGSSVEGISVKGMEMTFSAGTYLGPADE